MKDVTNKPEQENIVDKVARGEWPENTPSEFAWRKWNQGEGICIEDNGFPPERGCRLTIKEFDSVLDKLQYIREIGRYAVR